jgi:hypothetical protein
MAAMSSQALATRLDSGGTKRSRSSESEDPWAGVGADSSGPPTPDYGDEPSTGPPCWQVGEDIGGLSNSIEKYNKEKIILKNCSPSMHFFQTGGAA